MCSVGTPKALIAQELGILKSQVYLANSFFSSPLWVGIPLFKIVNLKTELLR